MDNTSKLKDYRGNCHCGLFKFTIKVPPLKSVSNCNCSFCSRNGYLCVPVPDENMVIEKGEGSLRSYTFGKKVMIHQFCPTCGSSIMGRWTDAPAGEGLRINIRMLRDVDLEGLEIKTFQGANIGEIYQPPEPITPENDELEDGWKIYTGNCHCGAVKHAVKTKPLTDLKVLSCNCSLCSRNGDLWIYPSKSAVTLHGGENLTEYAFLEKTSLHTFCSICGVTVGVRVTDPKEDVIPLNVRTINGIDLEGLTLQKYDGRSNDPQYMV